jgi:hypothetical protein
MKRVYRFRVLGKRVPRWLFPYGAHPNIFPTGDTRYLPYITNQSVRWAFLRLMRPDKSTPGAISGGRN